MTSHLDARVSRLYERFFLNPFQFFGEKEIHYIFGEAIWEMLQKDPKWKGARLMREFPTSQKYRREFGVLKRDDKGTRAFIDLVIQHFGLTVGFEFFLDKETIPTHLEYGQREYWLRNRSVSVRKAIIHAKNDWLKLSDKKDLDLGYLILFIAGFSTDPMAYERFVRKKRTRILAELKKLSDSGDDSIRILYCERYCIESLAGTTNRFKEQFGYRDL